MCHGHWIHDRLIAGEPLDELEFDTHSPADDVETDEEPEPLAQVADD